MKNGKCFNLTTNFEKSIENIDITCCFILKLNFFKRRTVWNCSKSWKTVSMNLDQTPKDLEIDLSQIWSQGFFEGENAEWALRVKKHRNSYPSFLGKTSPKCSWSKSSKYWFLKMTKNCLISWDMIMTGLTYFIFGKLFRDMNIDNDLWSSSCPILTSFWKGGAR